MKLKMISSMIIIFLFASCKTDLNKVCDISDPMSEISWLTEKKGIENICISKIILKDKEKKKRIDGFAIAPNESYPDAITAFYSCSGELLCSVGGIDGQLCERYEIIKEEIIYMTD